MVFAIASHGQPPVAPPVIPPMEAHWPLDDGKGSVVTEVIGGLNGTLNNADTEAAWISGTLGGALRLDGIDDRVIVPHNPAFDFADEDFSVSFLMRWPKGVVPHHEHFLTKGDYASAAPDETGKRWEIIMASGKGVCFNIDDDVNKSQILVPFDAFTTGEWVHVVAVRDTVKNQLRLYADGVLQQASRPDDPKYDGIDRTGSISNPQNLFIGDASRRDNPFQGDLDDVRIFRSALTEQQIVAIASLAIQASPAAGAADLVVEVESLELSNAEVRDLDGASGKVVAFDTEGAEAKGEVELDRGVYEVNLYMFAPDPEQDAVYVAIGETQERVYHTIHGALAETESFPLNIPEKKKYPISITFGEPGVLLDRLVIQPIPDQTVTEPAEKESGSADTMTESADVESQSSAKKAIVLEEYVFMKGPTRDCHSSSLLELENGDLLCTYFGGMREGAPDVNIWLARKPAGGKWQPPVSIADGGGNTVFNPVLVQPKGGDIMIFYCSPNIDTGEVITSSDNGHTWSSPKRLPEGFVGPIVNKAVQLDDGTIIAGSSLQGGGRRIHVEHSTDNGKTWTKIGPISDPKNTKYEIIQPTILVHSQKRLQILARTNQKDKDAKLAQTWSEDGGLTWSPVTDATLPNNNSAVDAVTLDDGRHLLVYNHSTRQDPIGGRKGRGILTVALTEDGVNWEAAAVLEYRTGSVQYSYPAVIQTKDGLVHVTYSWHRKRIKHVVIDPKKLETYPIVDGQWPKDKMSWIESDESTEMTGAAEVLK